MVHVEAKPYNTVTSVYARKTQQFWGIFFSLEHLHTTPLGMRDLERGFEACVEKGHAT